jgi:hypothetical protein
MPNKNRASRIEASEQLDAINLFLTRVTGDPGPRRTTFERVVAVVAQLQLAAIEDAGKSLMRGHMAVLARTADSTIDRLANTIVDASERMGRVHALLLAFLLPSTDHEVRARRARKIVREARLAGVDSVTVDQVLRMMAAAHATDESDGTLRPSTTVLEELNTLQQRVSTISVRLARLTGEPIDHHQYGEGSIALADAIIARLEKMKKESADGPVPTITTAFIENDAGLLTNKTGLCLVEIMVEFVGSVYVAATTPSRFNTLADVGAYLRAHNYTHDPSSRHHVRYSERTMVLDEVMAKFAAVEEEQLLGVW